MAELWLALVVRLIVVVALGYLGVAGVMALLSAFSHRSSQRGTCPRCLAPFVPTGDACRQCGWSLAPPPAETRIQALEAIRAELDRWLARGEIPVATYHERRRAIVEELAFLRASQPSPAGAPIVAPREIAVEVIEAELVPSQSEFIQAAATTSYEPATAAAASTGQIESDVAERAARIAARRLHGDDVVDGDQAMVPPRAPQRAWGDVLSGFLEEKNIRWGELVGGALIVTCSVALVMSFWSEIAERPLIKFLVFNAVTASLFGLGLHAHRRWKLPTTSMGLLIIATLLTPLNFLAIAAMARDAAAIDPLTITGELASVAIFATLVYFGAAIVAQPYRAAVVVGVMVPAVMQLLVRRIVSVDVSTAALYSAVAVPLAAYACASAAIVVTSRRREFLEEDDALAALRAFGMVSFASAAALGLVLFKTGDVQASLDRLSPMICLLAAAPLAIGLTIFRRARLAAYQATGAAVAVAGGILLLVAVLSAWPHVARTTITAAAAAAAIAVVAARFRIPQGYPPAAACVALAWLFAAHVARGALGWDTSDPRMVMHELLSGASGVVLVPLALSLWLASGAMRRWPGDASYLKHSGTLVAAVSLALVMWFGFGVDGDPLGVAWIASIYAVCGVAGAYLFRSVVAARASAVLQFVAIAQLVVFRLDGAIAVGQPWISTLVSYAVIVTVIGATAHAARRARARVLVAPMLGAAQLAATFAVLLWIPAVRTESALYLGLSMLALAAVALAHALVERRAGIFVLFQVTTSIAIACLVTSGLSRFDWYAASPRAWLDPWSLQAQGIALAVQAVAWLAIRRALSRADRTSAAATESLAQTLQPFATACVAFERTLLSIVVALAFLLPHYGAMPGMAQELTPRGAFGVPNLPYVAAGATAVAAPRVVPAVRHFEIAAMPHEHALGWGSWALVGATLVALSVRVRGPLAIPRKDGQLHATIALLAMLAVGSSACALVAGWWEPETAVASAYRWASAGYLAIISAAMWGRTWWIRASRVSSESTHAADGALLAMLYTLAAAPLVCMIAFAGGIAIQLDTVAPVDVATIRALLVVLAIASAVALFLWNAQVETFAQVARGRGSNGATTAAGWPRVTAMVLVVLAAAPVVAMTFFLVGTAIARHPIVGPDTGSIFAQMGRAALYTVPVFVVACTLVGHAIAGRSSPLALAAGLLLNTAATAAYVMTLGAKGVALSVGGWMRLGELNAMVSAAFAAAWIAAVMFDRRRRGASQVGRAESHAAPLLVQLAVGIAFAVLVLLPPTWLVFDKPFRAMASLSGTAEPLAVASGTWGWSMLALVIASAVMYARSGRLRFTPGWWYAGILAVGSVAAFQIGSVHATYRLAYVALTVLHSAAGWILVAAGFALWFRAAHEQRQEASAPPGRGLRPVAPRDLLHEIERGVTRWSSVAAALATVWLLGSSAGGAYWQTTGLVATAILCSVVAIWSGRRGLVYATGALATVAVNVWWLNLAMPLGPPRQAFFEFLDVNVMAMAASALFTMAAAWLIDRLGWGRTRPRVIAYHRFAAGLALATVCLSTAVSLSWDVVGAFERGLTLASWLAVLAAGLAIVSTLWDRETRHGVAALYILGLAACGLAVDAFDLDRQHLLWTGVIMLAAFCLAASYLASRAAGLRRLADALGMPRGAAGDEAPAWLAPTNAVLAACVLGAAVSGQFYLDDFGMRLTSAKAAIAQALAVGFLARGKRQNLWQATALVYAAIGAVVWGWAWQEPGASALSRAIVAAVVIAVTTSIYGLGMAKLVRRFGAWTRAAERLAPALVAACVATVCLVLTLEFAEYYSTSSVAITTWESVAVLASFLFLVAASLTAAVVPGRDPLRLSERGRTAYVYGAEVLLALMGLHLRLTAPWLFAGLIERYWPFVTMGLAVLGVGLGEIFRRQNRQVLAEPLERTGALLPVLPILGYGLWPGAAPWSVVLAAAGTLYAIFAASRRNVLAGVAALVAYNGALWHILYSTAGMALYEHPQFWLVPPAVCVLTAVQLMQDRLSREQAAGARYLAASVLYLSSTVEIFLHGVADHFWLPMLLAGMSIAGILAGMLLRVRAFLFMGSSFLAVALFSVIWYAAVDAGQTWLWYVTGIAAGATLIAMFAVLEKQRPRVLQMVATLKQWEA